MQLISGETSLYGIIGDPVKHSLSPLFQNEFLRKNGENAVYLPFHVSPNTLQQALTGLHSANIQGLNITVPHKESALPMMNADKTATMIGAINTVKRTQQGWDATNTDWSGFADVLQGLNADIEKPALIFGAGGTSRAVAHALHHQGFKEVWICNRSEDRALRLVSHLQRNYPSLHAQSLEWSQKAVSNKILDCATIINTTSIGLNPNDVFPFSLSGKGIAIDAVYKPNGSTSFCTTAKDSGEYLTTDGLPMLIAQGIASFAFWHKNTLNNNQFNLPDKLESLQWVEGTLERQPLNLPGWEK